MMRMNNVKMSVAVDRVQLLEKLRSNLANHADIAREAREGYVAKAKEALRRRLEDLASGKLVSLVFQLTPPQDYSEVYRTTITMLEWSTDDKVTLTPDEFRQMVEDKWDWSDQFLGTNQAYSAKAFAATQMKMG